MALSDPIALSGKEDKLAELYTEAAAVYREAADKPLLQGAKPDNLLRLALALELSGETDPALEALADAIKLVPGGHPLLAFREAWIYYHAHRMTAAAQWNINPHPS